MNRTNELNDNELIRQIAAGSQDAFEVFFQKHSRQVERSLQHSFSLNEDCADVTQEVFTQIWRRAASFDPARGNAKAWMMVIARTRALDHLRSLDPVEPLEQDDASVPQSASLDAIEIRTAMEELPERYRAILELAYFDGYSHSQIAAKWNRPLGTVKTQIRAGLLMLRARLEQRQAAA